MIDLVLGLFNRGFSATLPFPASDPVFFFADLVPLDVKFGTELAFSTSWVRVGVHNELHTASLTGTVLLGTVGAKGAPLVVATLELVLVVIAHIGLEG